jgi:hypothetical protein
VGTTRELPVLSKRSSRLGLLREFDRAGSELEQALALLTECGITDPITLPVGVIDRLLLRVHRVLLGHDLELVNACRSCGVLNALPLGPSDVPEYAPRCAWCGPGAGLREPTAQDLLDLPVEQVAASELVAARCAIGPDEGARDADAFSNAEQSLCGVVRVACTECGDTIAEFVDVQRLVTSAAAAAIAEADVEVHLLASRYGWDLATIEALPEARRSRLATLVRGGGL